MAGLSLSLLLVVGLVTWVSLDESPYVAPTPAAPSEHVAPGLAAEVLLDLQRAVRSRDTAAAEALAPEDDQNARDVLAGIVDNARDARVTDFSVRYVDETGAVAQDGSWSAAVDTTWAFRGFDRVPAMTEVRFTFVREGDEVRLVGVGGGDRRSPVWLTGPADVRRTARTLVIAAEGQNVAPYAREARAAVPDVLAVLPHWRGGLVVEVPRSVTGLHQALAADPGAYDAIAAVTTSVDGTLTPESPVHVFVNPRVFSSLKPRGAQVVMSHEATHVATGAATSSSMPLWLLEGFADYVALRDVPLPIGTTAGQIIRQVRRDGPPSHLPGPEEFDTSATHLGASYEAAWLACRLLAQRGGEARLVRFYDQVDGGASVDAALADQFGIDERELTVQWRRYLAGLA